MLRLEGFVGFCPMRGRSGPCLMQTLREISFRFDSGCSSQAAVGYLVEKVLSFCSPNYQHSLLLVSNGSPGSVRIPTHSDQKPKS